MYLPADANSALGKSQLIWSTGVLYHNPEQLRMLRKFCRLLEAGGYLVLESATLRMEDSLKNGCFVQIHFPETYRNTGTITHLPTTNAIKAWLSMVGFMDIVSSDCYVKYNQDLIGSRFACICRKTGQDEGAAYYQESGLKPEYRFGDST